MKLEKKIAATVSILGATAGVIKAVYDYRHPVFVDPQILTQFSKTRKTYIIDVRKASLWSDGTPHFKEAFLLTSPDLDLGDRTSFKQCDKITLDFFFHGSDGIHKNKMRDAYDKSIKCHISISPYYNNEGDGDDKTWRYLKIRNVSFEKQKVILKEMFSFFHEFFETFTMKPIREVAFFNHSQGGVMTALVALHFPSGFIQICEKKRVKVLGYFSGDANYFENWDYWQVYFLMQFRELSAYGQDSDMLRQSIYDHAFDEYQIACNEAKKHNTSWNKHKGCDDWGNVRLKRIFDAVKDLQTFHIPKYYAAAWHNRWLHMTGLHYFASRENMRPCDDDLMRYYYYRTRTSEDCGSVFWRETIKGKYDGMHGNAYWLFISKAARFIWG